MLSIGMHTKTSRKIFPGSAQNSNQDNTVVKHNKRESIDKIVYKGV